MSRTIPSNTAVELAKRLGTELTPFIEIAWPSGTQYYSYTTRTISGRTYQGKLLNFESVQYQGKQTATAQVSSVSITLDDTDDSLRQLLNQHNLEHIVAKVYINYPTLSSHSDNVLLMIGKITSDIAWSEGERTLSFTVDTFITNNEVGYAPAEGDFAGLLDEAVDVTWPLCFGSINKVPAVRILGAIEGSLQSAIGPNTTSFYVDNGESFPQGRAIEIVVSGVTILGSFQGTKFTVTKMAQPEFSAGVNIGARVSGDVGENSSNVLWLSSYVNLENRYFLATIDGEKYVNYCIEQDGLRCTLSASFAANELATTGDTIDEISAVMLSSWENPSISVMVDVTAGTDAWTISDGTIVKHWTSASRFDAYVANLLPSTVLQILGKRSYKGMTVYTVIPSSYYEVTSGTALTGIDCTLIKFPKPLNEYDNQGWSGEVFVSLRSSQPNDTAPQSNTAKIIKWLLDTYATGLTTDTASFNSVAADIASYPSSFAVFDQEKVIQLCEDIAWQARCALLIENDVVYIRYLSKNPVSSVFLDEDSTVENSLVLGLSSFDSVVTKLTGTWVHNYSGDEDASHEYTYKNNISTYGLIEASRQFTIYNIEDCVKASVRFWGYRYSNVWRTASLKTFIKNTHLQVFDIGEVLYGVIGPNSINGVIESVNLDPNSPVVELGMEIAANAGTVIENPLYWWVPGIDLGTIKDPLYGLVLENDDEILEDDSSGGGITDPNNPDKETKYLVWRCTPSYIYQGLPSIFKLGLYDDPTPKTPPIKQGTWVELEVIGYKGNSIIPLHDLAKHYRYIDGGLSTFDLTITAAVELDRVHIFARAVIPRLNQDGQHTGEYDRDLTIKPDKTDDIPVDLPEEGEGLVTSVVRFTGIPVEVRRTEPFEVSVEGKEGTVVIFKIGSNTDPKDTLGAQGIQQTLTGGEDTFTLTVVGGAGADTFKIIASATPSECDPDEEIEAESGTIPIVEEDPYEPSSDEDDSNYDPDYDPVNNPEQLMALVEFQETTETGSTGTIKILQYRTRKLRVLNTGEMRITDFGDWQELLRASPCPPTS
jgi:hypothetical protein